MHVNTTGGAQIFGLISWGGGGGISIFSHFISAKIILQSHGTMKNSMGNCYRAKTNEDH